MKGAKKISDEQIVKYLLHELADKKKQEISDEEIGPMMVGGPLHAQEADVELEPWLAGGLAQESEIELEDIEEAIFLDDELYDRVKVLEMELIDDYVRGRLSAEERARFEMGFLTTEERKRKVEDAMVLMKYVEIKETEQAKESVITPIVSKEDKEKSFWQRMIKVFGFRMPVMQFAMAAVIVILTIGGAWLLYDSMRLRKELTQARDDRSRLKELEEKLRQKEAELKKTQEQTAEEGTNKEKQIEDLRGEIKELQEQIAKIPKEQQPELIAVVLTPTSKGGSGPRTIKLPSGTKTLQLQIPLESAESESYQLIVRAKNGNAIRSFKGVKPRRSGNRTSLFIRIPASILFAQAYQVVVQEEPVDPARPADFFEFKVVR